MHGKNAREELRRVAKLFPTKFRALRHKFSGFSGRLGGRLDERTEEGRKEERNGWIDGLTDGRTCGGVNK